MGRDTRPGCPKPLSSLALNMSRVGASRTSLGNLCQCLPSLTVKNFFLSSMVRAWSGAAEEMMQTASSALQQLCMGGLPGLILGCLLGDTSLFLPCFSQRVGDTSQPFPSSFQTSTVPRGGLSLPGPGRDSLGQLRGRGEGAPPALPCAHLYPAM